MAYLVFFLRPQLPEGTLQGRVIEQRVIAKTALSSRRPKQLALYLSANHQGLPIPPNQGHGADKLAAPGLLRHLLHIG